VTVAEIESLTLARPLVEPIEAAKTENRLLFIKAACMPREFWPAFRRSMDLPGSQISTSERAEARPTCAGREHECRNDANNAIKIGLFPIINPFTKPVYIHKAAFVKFFLAMNALRQLHTLADCELTVPVSFLDNLNH
jgi:hypothetical protein